MQVRRAVVALSVSVLLAGCSSEAGRASRVEPKPVLVALATAQPTSASGGLLATGTVRDRRETILSFTMPGRIAAIPVEDGQKVRQGQLLARLDPTPIAASSSAARAEAARARAELERVQALAEKGWVTRGRLEAAQATATAAQAQVAATSFDVRFSRIYAPGAGTVLRRHVEPNQTVAAGAPIVTIGEANGGYVLRVPLSDSDLARVRLGQGAAVTIAGLGDRPLAATVVEIAGRGDDRTGTFDIELALPSVAGLKSGLIGEARIRVPGEGDAVAIPVSAIWQARADEGFVYVVDANGIARARLVQLGTVNDREVVVTGGLAPGERIVRAGADRLRDGARVTTRTTRQAA